jgi:hypothetical protein
MDLYIYYKARIEHSNSLQLAALSMQSAVASKLNIATALKRRPDAKDGLHTWMEVYLDVPTDVETHLTYSLSQTNLSAIIEGGRHTEYFLNV